MTDVDSGLSSEEQLNAPHFPDSTTLIRSD